MRVWWGGGAGRVRRGFLLGALGALGSTLVACGGGRAERPGVEVRPAPAPVPVPALDAGARPAYAGPSDPRVSETDLDLLWARQLMVPVEGLSRRTLPDNFRAPRSAGRVHGALDLSAPRLTAVLAADDHVIGRLFSGPVGGIVIYATDPSGRFVYYYAHLDRYRRGLAVGDRIAKGSVIGYVGITGNASPTAPHLHFQVMKRGERAWWDGPPINPTRFFAFDGVRP